MIISSPSEHVAAVPTGLLTAAIDFINACRPEPQLVQTTVMALARRLDYDSTTAAALATRVTATARMFADPRWAAVRQWGCSSDPVVRAHYEADVQRFIAKAPLDATLTFDVGMLQRLLLVAMPPAGHC